MPVVAIGDYAFQSNSSLSSVKIPTSVASIGNAAFLACRNLANADIPGSATNIGRWAFEYCQSLTNATIPSSVANIGYVAFGSCSSLSAITVDPSNPYFASVDGVLADKNQTKLIQYPAGKASACYTIADTVTNIWVGVFYGCTNLTSVTVSKTVSVIGFGAFQNCTNLAGIYFSGDAPLLDVFVFYGTSNAVIYYLPGTSGWSSTYGGRPTMLWNPTIQTSTVSIGSLTNGFGFNITGTSSLVIFVEATANLANPVWSVLSTNTLTGGSYDFSDPQWTNHPARFYRLRSP